MLRIDIKICVDRIISFGATLFDTIDTIRFESNREKEVKGMLIKRVSLVDGWIRERTTLRGEKRKKRKEIMGKSQKKCVDGRGAYVVLFKANTEEERNAGF